MITYTVKIDPKDYPIRNSSKLDLTEFDADAIIHVECGRTFESMSFSYDTKKRELLIFGYGDHDRPWVGYLSIEYTSRSKDRNDKIEGIID